MKKLYLFLNKHMVTVAVCLALCLIPVAIVPDFGYVVSAALAAMCGLMFVGDHPANWLKEVIIDDCPGD